MEENRWESQNSTRVVALNKKKMRLYSVYYISVESFTCFGCWHPSSGAHTTVITASGTGQPGWPVDQLTQLTQLTSARSCNYSCTSSWWWVSTPETCRTVYRNVINWIQSHLVGQFFNLIHDARTHEYKIIRPRKPCCRKFKETSYSWNRNLI